VLPRLQCIVCIQIRCLDTTSVMKLNGFDKYQCIVFLLFTPSDAYSYYLDVFYHAYAFWTHIQALGITISSTIWTIQGSSPWMLCKVPNLHFLCIHHALTFMTTSHGYPIKFSNLMRTLRVQYRRTNNLAIQGLRKAIAVWFESLRSGFKEWRLKFVHYPCGHP
jgi:hypothetical protein